MIKQITYGLCAFMLATITHQPIQASPNKCEFLIASITRAHDLGYFDAEERDELIESCIRETWADPYNEL